MANERLFGTDVKPACKYCEFAFQKFDGDKILCDKKGVVLATYKCRSFVYDPIKRVPPPPRVIEKIEAEAFRI